MNFDLEPDLGNANVGKDNKTYASHLFGVACFFYMIKILALIYHIEGTHLIKDMEDEDEANNYKCEK